MAKHNKQVSSTIITDLLREFPNATSNAIARMAHERNPQVFTNKEHARTMVRYYRGAAGNVHRKTISTNEFIREIEYTPEMFNPFGLPESDCDDREYLPYYLPESCERVLCLYDIHFPYHDVQALTAALKYGKKKKVDTIFIGGDALDFYALSSFDKDPRKRGFAEELQMMRDFFATLRREFPKSRIFYLLGNHEERYQRYLRIKAPELLDVSDFELKILLRCGEYQVEVIDGKRVCKLGKLNLVHGHEFGQQMFSPVNPARGLYMKAKKSTICGHHHQTSEHTEPDIEGGVVTTWSVGCLCYLNPEYRPINKWNHGFAYIESKDGMYKVKNHRIINGDIV